MRKQKNILLGLICSVTIFSCTKSFDEINTDQNGFLSDEVSAKFFLTDTQYKLYSPDRFPYWRAHLIHADRFAGQFTFGFSGCWWSDGLGYTYDTGYTDAAYGWLAGYLGNLKGFTDFVKEGGELENEYMYAMALIMKGLYYQMYTETFGMVPYTEAGVEGILTPKYDTQQVIYKGIIAELDEAMAIIGSEERTGLGVDDAGSNDLYCGGDLQKWKKLANTLKLRIGMRALGADGDDFAATAISEALAAPLLDDATGSVVMEKDFVIDQWAAAAYGDVWHNFGGTGSKWTVSNILINMLQDNNDPRLSVYANPIVGGSFVYVNDGSDPNFQTRVDFVVATLDRAGADYTVTVNGNETTIEVPGGQYIGLPTRVNGDIMPYIRYDMFSLPSEMVTQQKGSQVDAYPEIVLTSAESYFLQAEAVLNGLQGASGDAQDLFAKGIKEAMRIWGVSDGDADTYIATEAAADITVGTLDEKLEKIAHQRWLASYTDGFEAWAVVRDTGYPAELAAGVTDPVIYELGTLNGAYPQRLRYGSGAQDNPNFSAVAPIQGANVQGTKLWFAK
ncbi:SusD/RagB family nutrient-binding outer membrane lipoprotein [Flagellimonas taeanensis]|uniref:Starch-binding associating with outer membrane n=1 Tax=Flagellimonas taeanensis TaxID=1005926 RepID=A0A1M7B3A1_9FLAO|nr:SusD/RagB family nutrient-binding outer membrane lipoprotein [Allomuricauda taeanensis]RIV51379.1 SusD/RagB family nutrient-binding outer membrane lipoprotein [Allomuricauda taeanensis]SFC37290.1 Starch-binding associating with outer membrane [Allomuricauda taeanensis]SHL49488.1 Starch-binding associating with outer membrane [Allomuricauda taeanensis]